MINSKPADLLDHDHLEDVEGNIYVVVGNTHPPGEVIAYIKYVPTSTKTIWCRGFKCYERVIRRYGVRNVVNAVVKYQNYSLDPIFGAKIPKIPLSRVSTIYKPTTRLYEILQSPRDQLEVQVANLAVTIEQYTGIPISKLGINGSILVKIHNPKYSDIDLSLIHI